MKANKTENRFQTGFQQSKSGLQKTDINISSYIYELICYHFG